MKMHFDFDRRDEEYDLDMEEHHGFILHNTPNPHPLLKAGQEDLFNFLKNIKFRNLAKIGKVKTEVKNYKCVIVKARQNADFVCFTWI